MVSPFNFLNLPRAAGGYGKGLVYPGQQVIGIGFKVVEVDPFTDPPNPELIRLHPFGRVPVLHDGDFILYETTAILRYLETAAPLPKLIPDTPRAQARMQQAISIMDAYGYQPLVRQVYSHQVFRPAFGLEADPQKIIDGMQAAPSVLQALDDIAREGLVLTGQNLSLADLHLAPMIGYFQMAPEGKRLLGDYAALSLWWHEMRQTHGYLEVC